MRNFKITLEYDGKDFCGWQTQGQGERTVQGELERTLARIFKRQVRIAASGRTDSGVHALGQVISFKAETRMKPLEIQKAMNSYLPKDIAVLDVREVNTHFHAQYSVKDKTYRYTILNRQYRSAFLRDHALFYPYPLDLARMRRSAKCLIGRHDFKSFQAHDPARAERRTIRTIRTLRIHKQGDLIHMDVTADGFLYKMVRNIVGTLLAVGAGQMPAAEMPQVLKSRNRGKAHDTAPAEGLCLMKVNYKKTGTH